MFETLHCIALRTIKYSDSRSILSAWSAERGYVSFAMPAGKGREASRRRALTMPLAAFEGVCDIRGDRDVIFIRDLKPMQVGMAMISDPAKLAMALFLAEIFEKLLRNSTHDDALSLTVFDTVDALNRAGARGVANFALWTLYRLTVPLGIEPDMSDWQPKALFDLEAARWRLSLPSSSVAVTGDEAKAVRLLSRLTRDNIERVRLTRADRRALLDGLLHYYDLHYCKLTPLHSLDVVSELF
ncbi:MAG: DNA repair protein RecO C-terminal domain-containing protein [Muribaculaceae bacterium]|nr:DNA repair protein RecO C-terminal domain-containing protein [Muribaculaceae bacterium]